MPDPAHNIGPHGDPGVNKELDMPEHLTHAQAVAGQAKVKPRDIYAAAEHPDKIKGGKPADLSQHAVSSRRDHEPGKPVGPHPDDIPIPKDKQERHEPGKAPGPPTVTVAAP